MRAETHLPLKVIFACLLAVAMLATVLPLPLLAAETPSVSIAPGRTHDRAVRYSDTLEARIKVSGAAGSDALLSQARLVALDADGTIVREQSVAGILLNNPAPAAQEDYLYNDGGTIKGALSLDCGFGSREIGCPADPSSAVRAVLLEVNVGETRVASEPLRVDYSRPYIRRYELISSNQIRVLFSEPVRAAADVVQTQAWQVDGLKSVVNVSAPQSNDCDYAADEDERAGTDGCSRILTLGHPLDQDATPRVSMVVNPVEPYQDFATNGVMYTQEFNSANQADSNAADLIRPVAPHIQTIDGKSGSGTSVVSNTPSPEARLTNLTGGHTLEITMQRPSGTTRKLIESVPAGANSLDITLPASNDGAYTITAVAIDTNGNRSDDASKNPPALTTDGPRSSATYVLDTIAPQVLSAALRNRRTVDVRFTEDITPSDDAGNWFVGDVPVTASGEGDTRVLKSEIDLTNPGAVRWAPSSSSSRPGSVGRYGDLAGNGMQPLDGLSLEDLPAVKAPTVTSPARVVYTKSSGFRITGTGPDQANLAVDLFEQGGEKVLRSANVVSGGWTIDQALDADGRYSYAVQLRDTKTGGISPRVPVADIVRDTAAPVVTVHAPSATLLGAPAEYGVGDTVTVRWTATDTANDPKRPDHGRTASIFLVDSTGTKRAVKTGIQHQPGQEQTYDYTLKAADLAGAGTQDLRFEVAVTDLAKNVGRKTSGVVRLVGTLIGYRAVLTDITVGDTASTIKVRFADTVQGPSAPLGWTVDGTAYPAELSKNGRTVTLTVPFTSDRNATYDVQYTAPALAPMKLQGADGRRISEAPRPTVDRLVPTLSVTPPKTRRVVDRNAVKFTGTTDRTARPNTIAAFPADATGARKGPAVATSTSAQDGTWTLRVPLNPDRKNRIVIQAVDPSGNRSKTLPSSPYTVIEDSKKPVLRIIDPSAGDTLKAVKKLRWKTWEANKRSVAIHFKKRNGTKWQTVAAKTADDGAYRWELPRKKLRGKIFTLRMIATDATGKRDVAKVGGLRANFSR